MKVSIFALCALCLFSPAVFPQTVKVELYADADRTQCALIDQGMAVHSIYVFHTGSGFSTGLTFSVPKPACWTGATWVQDVNLYPSFGNSQTSWTVGYNSCFPLPVLVGWVRFLATGVGQRCCEVVAVPVEYIECPFTPLPLASGQKVFINPDATCQCGGPVATDRTTWGRVKSLFR